jgi:hypothetical protein
VEGAVSDHFASSAEAEIILPFPNPLQDATAFRSTWLRSSLDGLRELDLYDAYVERLPRAYHDTIMLGVAGAWLPLEVATAHYAAFESLELSALQIQAMGRAVTNRARGTAFSTLVGLVKQSGATPWHAMMQFNRLWARVWLGGGVCVTKLGPKDAVIELGGWPLAKFSYVHHVMPYIAQAMLEVFCRRAFTRAGPTNRMKAVAVLASWV